MPVSCRALTAPLRHVMARNPPPDPSTPIMGTCREDSHGNTIDWPQELNYKRHYKGQSGSHSCYTPTWWPLTCFSFSGALEPSSFFMDARTLRRRICRKFFSSLHSARENLKSGFLLKEDTWISLPLFKVKHKNALLFCPLWLCIDRRHSIFKLLNSYS